MDKRDQNRGYSVRGLGEIAIRCTDIAAMRAFYHDVIGLPILNDSGAGIIFFSLGEGYGGHTTILALFAADAQMRDVHPRDPGQAVQTGAGSSLHHLALTVGYAEQENVIKWYEKLGQPYTIQHFDWIGWRGVFTNDPEGNTVELVAATGKGPA